MVLITILVFVQMVIVKVQAILGTLKHVLKDTLTAILVILSMVNTHRHLVLRQQQVHTVHLQLHVPQERFVLKVQALLIFQYLLAFIVQVLAEGQLMT